MTFIPVTYNDDNEDDRNFEDDLWSWLKDQPQDVWLLLVRCINQGQTDRLLYNMVNHPACDLAIAYYLFWTSGPAFYVANPANYHEGQLIHTIVKNCERGFYKAAELFCNPLEVAPAVQSYSKAVQALGVENPNFKVPDILIGPINGRKAAVPATWSKELWLEIDDVVSNFDCTLPKSEDEYWQGQIAGGNVRLAQTLANQGNMNFATRDNSVFDKLQTIYGTATAYVKPNQPTSGLQPIYMQKQTALNPNLNERYIGYFFLFFVCPILSVYLIYRWLH
jgi:Domain of unknown function (DUF4274)